MGVFDLFSSRQRRARGEVPDVYVYDKLPQELRVQIVHIIRDAFGVDNYGTHNSENAYEFVKETLCREYGLFELIERPSRTSIQSSTSSCRKSQSSERSMLSNSASG